MIFKKTQNLVHCWWQCKINATTMKNSIEVLKEIKIQLPFDSEILLLCIYPKVRKTGYQKYIHNPIFMVPLFKIANK